MLNISKTLRVGSLLSNGANLLAWALQEESVVVLALYHNEYVTWLMDAKGDPYEGHYHKDLLTAVDEYKKRIHGGSMKETASNELKEKIAMLINHGLEDTEVAVELVKEGDILSCSPALITIIRDLMSKRHADAPI